VIQVNVPANNMISIRKTTANLFNIIGGEMLLRLANAAVAVLIGRIYGAPVLGIYAAVIAAATLAERLADNGLEMSGIAEVSRNPAHASELATALYIDKIILSITALTGLLCLGWLSAPPLTYWGVAVLLTLRTFLYSFCRLHAGLLKALDRTTEIACIQSIHFVLLLMCVFAIYLSAQSIRILLFCLIAIQFIEYLLSLAVLRSSGVHLARVSARFCWRLVRWSTSVGLTYTLLTLMLRGDVLIVSVLAPAAVVGAFAAADTGLVLAYVVAWLFSGVLLADLGRLAADQTAFDAYFRKCIVTVSRITVPLAVIGALGAPFAIRVLFGKSFVAAGVPGAMMALAIPFIFLNAAYLSRAVALRGSRVLLAITGSAAFLSLALNYLFGLRYGPRGVAWSIVIREAAMTVAFLCIGKLVASSVDSEPLIHRKPKFADILDA
jgi:O-antigen/teichoic acid export membrane protein